MKWMVCLTLSLVSCGLALLGLFSGPQMLGVSPSPLGGETEPSPCLTEATIALTANPTSVVLGQSSTVSWSVSLPSDCSAVQVRFNGQSVSSSGSRSVTPSRTSKFRVVVSQTYLGAYSEKSESVEVAVNYPQPVVINPSTSAEGLDPVQVLLGALTDSANPEQTVELCDVDLDLTGMRSIEIGDNRSLIASPGCARGPRSFGPRIFVTDERGNEPLFLIRGDNVLFSGFRLEGPTHSMAQGERKEKGIVIAPGDCQPPVPSTPGQWPPPCAIKNVEVSNMEIFHWSGVGVQVTDNVEHQRRGRLFNTFAVEPEKRNVVGAAHIKGNFFHDNLHGSGDGYGVESTAGAYVLIEQNVFDNNRHAIAGGSKNCSGPSSPTPTPTPGVDYSGYTARDNLILSGGGRHCADNLGTGLVGGIVVGSIIGSLLGLFGGVWGAVGGGIVGAGIGAVLGGALGGLCWQTHQIDMHGDKNEVPNLGCGKDYCHQEKHWYSVNCHNWECGRAGETMIIERNTILYTSGTPIKIRGNPVDKAVVDNNIFKHEQDGATAQGGNCGYGDNVINPIIKTNNRFKRDPTKEVGWCDFAGDGQQDQFMATGVTWWAWSPLTKQWRYLNTMSEELPELTLADMDGDGVCDVAPKTRRPHEMPVYSKSGVGPWVRRIVIPP